MLESDLKELKKKRAIKKRKKHLKAIAWPFKVPTTGLQRKSRKAIRNKLAKKGRLATRKFVVSIQEAQLH